MTLIALLGSLAATAADTIGSIDGRWLALALSAQLVQLLLRAVAWRNAIAAAYPDRPVPRGALAAAYVAGVALNSFAPARAGEAAKIALARMQLSRSSVGTLAAAGAVLLVLDAAVTAALVAATWWSGAIPGVAVPASPAAVSFATANPPAAAGIAVTAAAALLLALRRLRAPVTRLAGQLAQGLAIMKAPGRYLREVAVLQLGA